MNTMSHADWTPPRRATVRRHALWVWALVLFAALFSGYVNLLHDHVQDAAARQAAQRLTANSPAAERLREAQREERLRELQSLWHPPVAAQRPIAPY
jgi:hypothetical protein